VPLFRGFEAIHSVLWDLPRHGPWPFEVTDVFADVSEATLGIPRQRAVAAVMDRTDVTTLYLDPTDSAHRVSLYMKAPKEENDNGVTLVCTEDGQHPTKLHFALNIDRTHVLIPSVPSPVKLIERLLEQAGEPLACEGSPKLLLHGEMPMAEWEAMIAGSRRRKDGYLPFYLGMQIASEHQPRVRVLLAFCLNLRKLRQPACIE
jgi:hypothetical protein